MGWETVGCNECGKEYKVQVYGPQKTRDWKVSNWRGICDNCKEAAKAALVEQNKSGDLPELTGSDKQIAWAIKIRTTWKVWAENMSDLERKDIIDDCKDDHKLAVDTNLIQVAIADILENTSAHWWIESRNELDDEMIVEAIVKITGSVESDAIDTDLQADVEAEAVMSPGATLTDTIADITVGKEAITISFPEKNDDFKEVIKAHGYRWDGIWKKGLSFKTGITEDRVAEIGHELLSAGFSVRIINSEIRQKIINQDFTQEHTRWVSVLTSKPKHFYIQWTYSDNMYDAAKKITGARYHKPGMSVPMENVDEVLDFSGMYKFRFSPAAEKLIKQAQVNKTAALVVKVKKIRKEEPPTPDGVPTLTVPEYVEIDDEFKD